jgi:hypothetical protein
MSFTRSLRYLATSQLLLLAACLVSEKGEHAPSSFGSDSAAGRASPNHDSAASAHKTEVAPVAEYRDSADVFDPDGYFALTDTLTIDGRTIETLDLHTVDFYYGGELHYDRPRLVQPPDVRLILSDQRTAPDGIGDAEEDGGSQSTYRCEAARITADSLSVRCAGTAAGDVMIEGHFLDKRGNFWDRFDERSVELLVARITVSRGGAIIHDAVHRFTYFVGD